MARVWWQVKLCDPCKIRVSPERFEVFIIRRYIYKCPRLHIIFMEFSPNVSVVHAPYWQEVTIQKNSNIALQTSKYTANKWLFCVYLFSFSY